MRLRGILVVVVVACGGGSGGGSASLAIQRSIGVTCGKAFDCMASFPPDAGFEFESLFGSSEPACTQTLSTILAPDDVQASVQSGRILFDAADADLCLDAAAALSCEQFWADFTGDAPAPQPAECETAFIGTVGLGEPCTIDLDCTEGFCDDRTKTCTP